MNTKVQIVTLALVAILLGAEGARVRMHSRSDAPDGWRRTGRAGPKDVVTVWFALRQQNMDELARITLDLADIDSPNYAKWMTRDEILDLVAPPAEETEAVLEWLRSEGIPDLAITNNRDAIRVIAPAPRMEALLRTTFHVFTNEDQARDTVAAIGSWSVPEHLGNIVEMVTGVSYFPIPKHISKRPLEGAYSSSSIYSMDSSLGSTFWPQKGRVVPEILQQQYNIPASTTVTNSKTSMAVAEFQGTDCFYWEDLQGYTEKVGVTFTNVSRIINKQNFQPTSCSTESNLDLECMVGLAPGVDAVYFSNDAWIYDFAQQYQTLDNAPLVTSLSWGWMEADQCQIGSCSSLGVDNTQYITNTDEEMNKLGAMGYTLVICTQDEGAPSDNNQDCQNTQKPVWPIYPASSAWSTAVGATTLLDASSDAEERDVEFSTPICDKIHCSKGTMETTAMSPNAAFTSGGGFSDLIAQPSWQAAAVSAYLSSPAVRPASGVFNPKNRAYPDISAIGENIFVYSSMNQNHFSGGTSGSTPIVASTLTLVNDWLLNNGGKPLGFVTPLLYKMAAEQPNTLNDITSGNNTCTGWGREDPCCAGAGYQAYTGWDPATGLGTPNYGNMIAYLQKKLNLGENQA